MTVDDLIKSSAAVLAWHAAHKDGANAMLGVLFVIRNRAKRGDYNGNWVEIINRLNVAANYPVLLPDPRDPDFQMVMQAVDGIFNDELVDNLTDGATSYSRVSEYALGMERVAQIGTMNFYKAVER